ncbi:MAG: glutamate synthase [Planctomycetota bacterium]|nr:MAG: glutamate synthase [Planctomycetota bacterium]
MGSGPIELCVKAGQKIAICTCGKSEDGRCNGSHVGTDKLPVIYDAQKDETLYVCGCTNTCGKPFCDGSHSK